MSKIAFIKLRNMKGSFVSAVLHFFTSVSLSFQFKISLFHFWILPTADTKTRSHVFAYTSAEAVWGNHFYTCEGVRGKITRQHCKHHKRPFQVDDLISGLKWVELLSAPACELNRITSHLLWLYQPIIINLLCSVLCIQKRIFSKK